MQFFFYLLKLIKTILNSKKVFKNLEHKNIIFFDSSATPEYFDVISNRDDYFLIECLRENKEIEKIYLSPKVLFFILIEIIKGNVGTCYYTSLIKAIDPKVVITFVDYNFAFFKLAKKLDKNYKFIAVQNAHRDLFDFTEANLKKIYIPEYFCFGQNTIDHYRAFKTNIKNFKIIGSPTLSLALKKINYIEKNKKKNTYICLIAGSIPRVSSSINKDHLKLIREKEINLWKFASKFSSKHKIYFKLASRHPVDFGENEFKKKERYDYEKNLFSEINGENKYFERIDRFRKNFSSYKLAFESELVIASHSTLLLESMAIGKKIMCVSRSNSYSSMSINPLMPKDNISSIYNPTYEEFEDRLLKLLKLTDEKYSEIFSYKKDYMIFHKKNNLALDIIKLEIEKIVNRD